MRAVTSGRLNRLRNAQPTVAAACRSRVSLSAAEPPATRVSARRAQVPGPPIAITASTSARSAGGRPSVGGEAASRCAAATWSAQRDPSSSSCSPPVHSAGSDRWPSHCSVPARSCLRSRRIGAAQYQASSSGPAVGASATICRSSPAMAAAARATVSSRDAGTPSRAPSSRGSASRARARLG
jgi:hypothetical protein